MRKWTLDNLRSEALKFKTRNDFAKTSASAYASAWKKNLLDEICQHMPPRHRNVYTKDECIEMAIKCGMRIAFIKNAPSHFYAAKVNGWLDEINSLIESRLKQWTDEEIVSVARGCKTPKELELQNGSVYQLLQRRGLYAEATAHMDRSRNVWSRQDIEEEALKFSTKKDFERGNSAAYQYARRRGWLDEACVHMHRRIKSDHDAIYLWRAKGERYNGKDVYKIGVTSCVLGKQRIQLTAYRNKMTPEIIFLGKTNCSAKKLEQSLLLYGDNPKFNVDDGKTEFRALSVEEMESVVREMRSACVVDAVDKQELGEPA